MNELILQTGPYKTTLVGTEILRASTKDEWHNYGEILRRVEEAKQWAIGDWLVDGKRHYGDGLYIEAEKILEIPQQRLRQYKSLSDTFSELFWRQNNLSYSHHEQVSSIKKIKIDIRGKLYLSEEFDIEKATELLGQAEKESWSVRDLREKVSEYKRRQQAEIALANEPEKFQVILADPAWEYDFSLSSSREIDNQYKPSTLAEMARLKVPAADDCVLFIWATSPKLREALELIEAWGFDYKTCMVWIKDKIGMGYYARQKHELLLIAGKGSLHLPDENKRPESVFYADRTDHSEKPLIVYELIESMYPTFKKLEMFARMSREGWSAWGDEL